MKQFCIKTVNTQKKKVEFINFKKNRNLLEEAKQDARLPRHFCTFSFFFKNAS